GRRQRSRPRLRPLWPPAGLQSLSGARSPVPTLFAGAGRSGAGRPRRRQGRPPPDRHVAALEGKGTAVMRIGIDFDNTIACYDGVFHAAALERGLIPKDLARDKNSVR